LGIPNADSTFPANALAITLPPLGYVQSEIPPHTLCLNARDALARALLCFSTGEVPKLEQKSAGCDYTVSALRGAKRVAVRLYD
jgi:hypothetical protein